MDTFENGALVARPTQRIWRRHSAEFKARVIDLACQGGASVAAVALANGLNANMLRRWVREHEQSQSAQGESKVAFVQLPMDPVAAPIASPPASERVQVQIERGDIRIVVRLALDSSSAGWLREVLG